MQIKPAGWPDTGRTYPKGAILTVFRTEHFDDLAWYDVRRDVWVYLSTIKRKHGTRQLSVHPHQEE